MIRKPKLSEAGQKERTVTSGGISREMQGFCTIAEQHGDIDFGRRLHEAAFVPKEASAGTVRLLLRQHS